MHRRKKRTAASAKSASDERKIRGSGFNLSTTTAAAAVYLRRKIDAHSARMALFYSSTSVTHCAWYLLFLTGASGFCQPQEAQPRFVHIERSIEPIPSITSSAAITCVELALYFAWIKTIFLLCFFIFRTDASKINNF